MSCNNVSELEYHAGTDTPKANKETSNSSKKNFKNQCATEDDDLNQAPFAFSNFLDFFFSGFLGDLCVI